MNIALIAAISENNAIGIKGRIPWHISDDLKRFKTLTAGKVVIMGRNTFDSLNQKALPNRYNIVLSTNPKLDLVSADDSVAVAKSVNECFALIELLGDRYDQSEIMVIGGERIYEIFLPMASKLYITKVIHYVNGDSFFPEIDSDRWCIADRSDIEQTADQLQYHYTTYKRR